jgi:hypothetical protein
VGVWFDPLYGDFGSYTNQTIIKYVANKESNFVNDRPIDMSRLQKIVVVEK